MPIEYNQFVPSENIDQTIRYIHQQRPLDERIEDENSTEQKTHDEHVWMIHKDHFDYKNIDIKSPVQIIHDNMNLDLSIRDTNDTIISLLDYSQWGDDVIFINRLYTLSEHRGKGFGEFLMREMTKIADDKCYTIKLDAHPYGKNEGDYSKQLQHRVDFYAQFGFEPHGIIHKKNDEEEYSNCFDDCVDLCIGDSFDDSDVIGKCNETCESSCDAQFTEPIRTIDMDDEQPMIRYPICDR